MSRIGKKILTVPHGVAIQVEKNVLKVKGPKGELLQKLHPSISINIEGANVKIAVKNPKEKKERALWGLFGSLTANMLKGVVEGFSKKLEINGVGYRAVVKGKNLELELGFSHPVLFAIPDGIEIKVEKNVLIVTGIDKQLVGEVAASIRSLKKPEPYKGKGIKYADEVIRKKVGKQAKSAE
ncbi:MAG: 50S ribosomal protein L6 [Candidatus Kerfeldbacteria bacterium RIFCSPHIGHO2_02_FULL_42_14]|uniref:Large ribosomal subunit protein uL6 n=1 Tax=Candidatus Kerfeldbacteria bacterium RIFCSPHIGHO2_02_FULL_42_14 TaxID=1798540 RepID=A0A1G2AUB5_9BACT|nr:MAG: 50S ribosomal protein L6 [Candidatus Kerfeldbacteria bacterium RIFCSPHIGHO2_02_FULL_42_14]OGY80413.1 MAG: 50S ribosomal protein L6 [Candidatus Kerfeldbacteria bacterium RIFCSPHIGHO2_12_FULL_42_13]OGY83843.1 MAG: 50S ribosomal protein L6 [Candidatus Kerfeldbacteria bacterium RIFCSPLOWO2_02_FULL_42_19]OGY85312.1 MAG: 50S ribosomal protein L6 [Candidatus Kerfeldbacteria bacterium RIFCSPLOWO2_12_FULL_43_9]